MSEYYFVVSLSLTSLTFLRAKHMISFVFLAESLLVHESSHQNISLHLASLSHTLIFPPHSLSYKFFWLVLLTVSYSDPGSLIYHQYIFGLGNKAYSVLLRVHERTTCLWTVLFLFYSVIVSLAVSMLLIKRLAWQHESLSPPDKWGTAIPGPACTLWF